MIISGNPWQSVETSGTQRPAVAISGNHLRSVRERDQRLLARIGAIGEQPRNQLHVIRTHGAIDEVPPEDLIRKTITCHQMPSDAIRSKQRQSEAIIDDEPPEYLIALEAIIFAGITPFPQLVEHRLAP